MIQQPLGPSSGNRSMQKIGKKGIIFRCLDTLKAPTFGTRLGKIKP